MRCKHTLYTPLIVYVIQLALPLATFNYIEHAH
jgi:hypothetical protein